ncbi:phage tail protein [Streptomyces sp. NPDC046876]|uniref:phage tail protein n=1 Tax=Streptomyces sp. NPDC046876 TaxID=3155616 RepID=UPI0034037BB4
MATGDSLAANRFSIQFGKFIAETVPGVTGLPLSSEALEAKQVDADGSLLIRKPAGAPQLNEITIRRGMDKSAAFTEWVKKTSAQQKPDEANPDLTIAAFDGQDTPVKRFHLTNAFACRWEGGQLDASASEMAKETVTISYEDLTIE